MIGVYSTFFNKSEFIELQINSFITNCKDYYEYIVINNSKNETEAQALYSLQSKYKFKIIEVEKDHKVPNISHFNALNQGLNYDLKKRSDLDYGVIIDSDVFPFIPFSFYDIFKNGDIGGIYQQRQDEVIEYVCPIFSFVKTEINLEELDFSWKTYTDSGGLTDNFIKKFNLTPVWVDHTAAIDIETDYIFQNKIFDFPYRPYFKSQFIAGSFIHYYRGSNWDEQRFDFHQEKLKFFKNFLLHPHLYNIKLDKIVHYDKAHANKGWEGKDNSNRNYRFKLNQLN